VAEVQGAGRGRGETGAGLGHGRAQSRRVPASVSRVCPGWKPAGTGLETGLPSGKPR
jgi:hypothetical protein